MSNRYNTIMLKDGGQPWIYDEARCQSTLKPGMLIQYHTNGKVKPHATAGGRTAVWIARENALEGYKTVDSAYNTTDNDLVQFFKAQKGQDFAVLLNTGESVTIGDQLTSNGDGTFQTLAGSEVGLLVANETYDNSAGSAPVLISASVL